ncbi:riboflavin biosynthesis protein RibF [Planctomycetota bacterium]
MRVIEEKSQLARIAKDGVLTIGNFDGVHLGHQRIIAAARQIASEKKADLAVMTFDPHPVAILYPEKAPGVLMSLPVRKYLIAACGADYLIVLKDSPELLRLSPQQFVDEFLVETFAPAVVVEGEDFNFGAGRAGSIGTLKELAVDRGFDVHVVGPEKVRLSTGQSVRVSSTMIRYMLESGHVIDAAAALGRPYRLIGPIKPGRGVGKSLGFPTLNMEKPNQIIPRLGVYAGTLEVADTQDKICTAHQKLPAVFSIGYARTYGDEHPLLIEAHLLIENAEQIKGDWMAMDFTAQIRSQLKFKTEHDLSAQIAKDCEKAKDILAKGSK